MTNQHADTETHTGPDGAPSPRALLLYYSFTGQSPRLLEGAGEVLERHGYTVEQARIEFTDPKYSARLKQFPLENVWRDMASVLPAQVRRATGSFTVPDNARDTGYDLVLIGSPTWWSAASIPVRSFLKSDDARQLLAGTPFAVFTVCRGSWRGNYKEVRKLAEWQGGHFVGEMHATYPGNEVTSMLSLTSYLGSGEYRDSYLGVPIPPTNVSDDHLDEARALAATIVDRLAAKAR